MTLHFVGGKVSNKIEVLKETKKYITFICWSNSCKYRYNKETKEVYDNYYGTKVIKGMTLDLKED